MIQSINMVTLVTKLQLKDFLKDPKEKGVKEPYYVIEGDEENITVLSSGKNGTEFNKTMGSFNSNPQIEIYRCLYGHGLLLIQRIDESGNAKEFRVLPLRPGLAFEVPSGYASVLVNTGKSFLLVADNATNVTKSNQSRYIDIVKEKRGLAYYVVDKQGDISFERNPNYQYYPELITQ